MTTEQDVVERRVAARALVVSPVLDRGDADLLGLVRKHRAELTRQFADQLGYRLDATRPGLARLNKSVGPAHVGRGLRARNGRAFDARRYAVACLVLSALETAGQRITARWLFEEVASRAATIDGLAFTTDLAADRRAFIQAVQAVEDLGILELAEGDEEAFARGQAGSDALFRVDRDRLGLLPAVTRPPSLADNPETMLTEAYPDTDEGRVRRRRHRVMRALVEQPVAYHDDLAPDEVDYLTSQRHSIERTLANLFGLDLEVRAEGWVAVDPDGSLTDVRWPDYGAAQTAALRLCDELRARRTTAAGRPWAAAEVEDFVAGLAAEYAGSWRKDAGGDGAAALTTEAVGILDAFRLARLDADGSLVALAAAARFAVPGPPAAASPPAPARPTPFPAPTPDPPIEEDQP